MRHTRLSTRWRHVNCVQYDEYMPCTIDDFALGKIVCLLLALLQRDLLR